MRDRPVWVVLLSRNVQSAMQFYREAVGWRFELLTDERVACWVAKSGDDEPLAVFVDASASDFPDARELWLPYFTVDDLDRRISEAEAKGATILREPSDIPGIGRVATLRQPDGGIVAWRSPAAS